MSVNPVIAIHQIRQYDTTEDAGSPIYKYFELLTAAFVMPLVGESLGITVEKSSRYAVGQYVWISGIGYLEIVALSGTTQIIVRNNNSQGNNAPGTVAPTGSCLAVCPPVDIAYSADDFFDLYDTLSQSFTVPVGATDAYAYLTHSDWYAVGQKILIIGAGWFTISDVETTTNRVTVQNASQWNAVAGTGVTAGSLVYPATPPDYLASGNVNIQRGVTGNVTLSANNYGAPTAVVFPIAFAAAPTNIQLTMHSAADAGNVGSTQFYVSGVTAAGFNIVHDSDLVAVVQFYWTAMA
jgi:hypothetical protein